MYSQRHLNQRRRVLGRTRTLRRERTKVSSFHRHSGLVRRQLPVSRASLRRSTGGVVLRIIVASSLGRLEERRTHRDHTAKCSCPTGRLWFITLCERCTAQVVTGAVLHLSFQGTCGCTECECQSPISFRVGRRMRLQRGSETDLLRHRPTDLQTAGLEQTLTRHCRTFRCCTTLRHPFPLQYDRDGHRLCVLLKCKTEEGTINIYRYLRAHEHKSREGRMLADGDIVTCLQHTILNNSSYLDQSLVSSKTNSAAISVTLPILTPPSPIRLTREQLQVRRAQISQIFQEPHDDNPAADRRKLLSPSPQSTPFSAGTVITPMSRLSSVQQ